MRGSKRRSKRIVLEWCYAQIEGAARDKQVTAAARFFDVADAVQCDRDAKLNAIAIGID